MVSAVGFISGGHFNPAVTLGFLVTRRIAPLLAVVYWVVQFGGAVLAALLLKWVLPSARRDGGEPRRRRRSAPASARGAGVVIEAVLTFFLVWVVFATAVDPRGAFKQIAGLAIGFTIAFDILMGGRPHRRGDEPGARVRAAARRATTGRTSGSGTSARSRAP